MKKCDSGKTARKLKRRAGLRTAGVLRVIEAGGRDAGPIIHQSQMGFSLVEVLVGTTILAVAVIAIVAALPQSYRQTTRAGRISTITHLAQEQIDQLKSLGYSSTLLTAGTHPAVPTLIGGSYYYPVSGFDGYSRRWIVTDFSSVTSGTNDMKKVVLEVGYNISYNDSGTQLLSQDDEKSIVVRFQTYISQ